MSYCAYANCCKEVVDYSNPDGSLKTCPYCNSPKGAFYNVHKTRRVQDIEWGIDEEVANLVELFNSLKNLKTSSSCQANKKDFGHVFIDGDIYKLTDLAVKLTSILRPFLYFGLDTVYGKKREYPEAYLSIRYTPYDDKWFLNFSFKHEIIPEITTILTNNVSRLN